MFADAMEHYGFTKWFDEAGYYETNQHRQLLDDITSAIYAGRLIAVCGFMGSGKTVTMRHLRVELKKKNHVLIAQSWALNKAHVTLRTLTDALFFDLAAGKRISLPENAEKWESVLRDLVSKQEKPIVLFIDDAHDLKPATLTDLGHLMDIVADDGNTLSIMLSGKPQLRDALRGASTEETRQRTDLFTLDDLAGNHRDYIMWLLDTCGDGTRAAHSVLTVQAVEMLAKLRTPLRVNYHLREALTVAYQAGGMPVSAAILESVFAKSAWAP